MQSREEFLEGVPGKPPPALTDVGNAERFAADHATSLRYVECWRKWVVWQGDRWKLDEGSMVMSRAKQTAKRIVQEATGEGCTGQDAYKAILAWAMASQHRSRIEAIVALATSEEPFPISHESLDADPWLLNTLSGTVDLRTGILREHDPGDLITKSTGVEYADGPGADTPVWAEFLATIFDNDQDLIAFLQRLFGVALVGEQLEHVLPVCQGGGANGKSVLLKAISDALGEYAGAAAPGLFLTSKGERHPAELADLCGKRVVVLQETRDGQKLDEGLVKSISGGDRIKARLMRQDFWEFTPSHTPLLVTNHRPVVTGTDNGIWRRLRLVPFNVTIPPERQDKRLSEKLRRESPGILRWMVEGCLAWQRDGLAEPKAVMMATDEYRHESDSLQQFIEEWAVVDEGACVKSSLMLRAYNEWSKQCGFREADAKWIKAEMVRRGYTPTKRNDGNYFVGIGLRDCEDH